ncbi:hypothetical protein Trydic_g11340 [Trypoxylus dichotomus]
MSGQHGTPSRVTKSSPSSMKQGPMRATIPMSSVIKQSTHIRKTHSPSLSPTWWKTRTSPDSGLRSPGSTAYKEKSKTLGSVGNTTGSAIRRAASLDTIYLKGQWPRDNFYLHIQIDKATQRSNNQQSSASRTGLSPGNSPVTADHTLTTSSQTNTSCIMPQLPRANPVNIPIKPLPKPTMRNSVEGLNQEIERLVLKSGKSETYYSDKNEEHKFCQVTPEGHRAPLPEVFRERCSVNTQTPSANDVMGSCHSLSGSVGSSPEHEGNKLGTSPHIFLARGPPDGCEKVHLKSGEERRSLPLEHSPQQPPCTFQLKPSLGSAFQILQPNLHSSSDQDLPLVPSQQDLI